MRAISKYKPLPPGCLYLEGRFNGGFFALQICGAYIYIFRNFTLIPAVVNTVNRVRFVSVVDKVDEVSVVTEVLLDEVNVLNGEGDVVG